MFQASHCSFMLPNVFLSKNCNCGLWKQFNRVCFLFLQRPCLVSSGVQSCISLTKCHLDVILMDVEVWLRMQWCQLQFYSNMLPDNKECTHWQERTAIWIWAHCCCGTFHTALWCLQSLNLSVDKALYVLLSLSVLLQIQQGDVTSLQITFGLVV